MESQRREGSYKVTQRIVNPRPKNETPRGEPSTRDEQNLQQMQKLKNTGGSSLVQKSNRANQGERLSGQALHTVRETASTQIELTAHSRHTHSANVSGLMYRPRHGDQPPPLPEAPNSSKVAESLGETLREGTGRSETTSADSPPNKRTFPAGTHPGCRKAG